MCVCVWQGRVRCVCVYVCVNECVRVFVFQVVELWDRVYQAWVVAHPQPLSPGPVVTSEAVALSFDTLMEGLKHSPGNS